MSQTIFSALPGYPGGKRRLVPLLGALLGTAIPPEAWPGLAFADAFLGGGSVSLWAKRVGFGSIHCNDIAERSAVIGRALIQNSTQTLSTADVLGLFAPGTPSTSNPVRLLERVEPPLVSRFLASAVEAARGAHPRSATADLLTVLLLHVCIHYFPMGVPSASDARHIASGDFDRVSGPRLKHYLGAGRRLVQPASLLKAAEAVNSAIIPGTGVSSRLDAFEFLGSLKADVVYLDPPYAGTQGYERVFELIDELLGADPLPASAFSSKQPPLDELLDSCRDAPFVLLSLNNSVFDEGDLRTLIERHRRVERLLSIPYRHYGSVATAAKNAKNREFVVLATRGPS